MRRKHRVNVTACPFAVCGDVCSPQAWLLCWGSFVHWGCTTASSKSISLECSQSYSKCHQGSISLLFPPPFLEHPACESGACNELSLLGSGKRAQCATGCFVKWGGCCCSLCSGVQELKYFNIYLGWLGLLLLEWLVLARLFALVH